MQPLLLSLLLFTCVLSDPKGQPIANRRDLEKMAKYEEALRAQSISFWPIATDSLGRMSTRTLAFVERMASDIAQHEDPSNVDRLRIMLRRELMQQWQVTLMRGNARMMLDCSNTARMRARNRQNPHDTPPPIFLPQIDFVAPSP